MAIVLNSSACHDGRLECVYDTGAHLCLRALRQDGKFTVDGKRLDKARGLAKRSNASMSFRQVASLLRDMLAPNRVLGSAIAGRVRHLPRPRLA
eukprot:6014697-Prymnesium_polylepis.1